jgi:lipopolysaccharide export system protein LptA
LIRISGLLSVFFVFVNISFAGIIPGKTVVTGDLMEIRDGGSVMVSKGNSKAVNKDNIVMADKMTYSRKNSVLLAAGNVKLLSKMQDNESVEACGEFAQYYMNDENGKFWGDNTVVKYFMQSSDLPLILKAREIYVDKKRETLSAYNDVKVITSSGTIYSDNAVFSRETLGVVFKKDKKRPIADVFYDGKKGIYEADEMIFYNSDCSKKIIMNGSVVGKIEMKEKIQ